MALVAITAYEVVLEKTSSGFSVETDTSFSNDDGATLLSRRKCQVHIVLDGETGEIREKGCKSVSCESDCTLVETKDGDRIHYRCDCGE